MLKYYLLFYTIVTGQIVKSSDRLVNLEEYMCVPLVRRPPHIEAAPSQRIHLYGETFQATRHHIIPFDTLSDFYTLVVREDPARREYAEALRRRVRLIYAHFVNSPNAGAIPINRRNDIDNRFATDFQMIAAFTWMPANLFYGPPPERRYMDPRDGLDIGAERITGRPAFNRLQSLYTSFRNYIDNEQYRTVDNFYAITNEIYDIAISRNRPYEFLEHEWVRTNRVDSAGRPLFALRGNNPPPEDGVVIEEIDDELKRKKRESTGNNHSGMTDEEYLQSARASCEELDKQGYFQNTKSEFCHKKGYAFEPRTGSCYKFHVAAKTWRQALSTCHAEGGHLAIINSQAESAVLKEMYERHPRDTIIGATEHRHAFIGYYQYRDGEWVTIYGDTLAEAGFTSWDAREPSTWQGNEFCGTIHVNGLLNNAPCHDISPFICEITDTYPRPAISLGWAAFEPGSTAECSECNGYKLEHRTGSYYKFHVAAKTWRQALSTCHAEGGDLAIINSQTEDAVLKEMYEKHPKETIIGATEHRHAFIGFQQHRDGEWVTIHGDSLAEAGFVGWDEREPSKWQGNEFCGSIHVNGLLNNAPCGDQSPFICEITL